MGLRRAVGWEFADLYLEIWSGLGGLGLVHVAAKKFILCADDDSLSGRSSADDVSVGCECVSMQLARVSDGVLDG